MMSEEQRYYVGGLSSIVKDEDLAQLFGKFGEIRKAVVAKDIGNYLLILIMLILKMAIVVDLVMYLL